MLPWVGSSPDKVEGGSWDMLCLPCLLPVTSFTGSQLPALSYCVSWCISLLWLQTFCSVKHGQITITVAPGALLALETFPQEVICHIDFTSYQLRWEGKNSLEQYIIVQVSTDWERRWGKKDIHGFGICLSIQESMQRIWCPQPGGFFSCGPF